MKTVFRFYGNSFLPHIGNKNKTLFPEFDKQLLNILQSTLHFHLHRAVPFISDPAGELQGAGKIHGAIAEAYALHMAVKNNMFPDLFHRQSLPAKRISYIIPFFKRMGSISCRIFYSLLQFLRRRRRRERTKFLA